MKNIEDIIIKDDLKYTKDHEWAKVEKDGLVRIGITDYAQDRLSDIVFVEMPEIGASFDKEEEFGTVESVKAVSEVYMPISGEVVEINETLEDSSELVNSEPYDGGWIITVKATDLSQLDSLMDGKAYFNMLKG
jgi:glycine cleavage system H protein